MPAEDRLSVRLLGQPKILWGDQVLSIKRKQARLLIYYLACQKTPVGRSDIMLFFWPDKSNARQQLRDLLSKTRSELPDPDILRIDRDWISLDQDRFTSDVLVFEEIYDQLSLPIMNIENRQLPEAIFQKLLAAVNLWEGPAFMSGSSAFKIDEINDWIDDQNRKLAKKLLSLKARIGQHLMLVGDLENSLTWLENVNENDVEYQFPQAIYHRLNVLYKLGRLNQAYEFGKEALDYFSSEWFSEFRLPFESLMKKIQNDRSQKNRSTQPKQRLIKENSVPFVGRDELMDTIKKVFWKGDILAITGETGYGKSRTYQEFIKQLETPMPTYILEAVYSERTIAFRPIIEFLRTTMNINDWQHIDKFWLSLLMPLLPELQSIFDYPTEYYSLIENQQLSLYESFRQVFLSLCQKEKIILCFENAQWLDQETVNFLSYLTQRNFFEEYARLILLISTEGNKTPVVQFLEESSGKTSMSIIPITPLTEEAISSIALYLLHNHLPFQLVQRLKNATGGNPLFVIETLQLLVEKPDLLDQNNWNDMPISAVLQIAIRDRLSHISDKARQVLNCGSLIGDEFLFDYIIAMVDFPELILVETIDELVQKNILTVCSLPQQPLRYRFNELFFRDVLLNDLSQTHKQVLHKRLAEYLINLEAMEKTADTLADIGYHLGHAGKSNEAFQYWVQAANLYSSQNENLKANQAYEQIMMLTQVSKLEMTNRQIYDIWIGWGELATIMNDFTSASEYYHRAVQEGLYRNSPLLIGSGLSGEGYLYLLRGLPSQAKQYLDRAAIHLKDGTMDEYILNVIRIMLVNFYSFDFRAVLAEYESIKWLESQLKTKRDQLIYASVHSTIALAYVFLGRFDEVELEANLTIEEGLKNNNSSLRIEGEYALSVMYHYKGNHKKSLDKLGLILRIAENNYFWRFVCETIAVVCNVYFSMGMTYLCYENIRNGYNLSKVHQYTGVHCILLNEEGKIYLAFGNYDKALALFNEALQYSQMEYFGFTNQVWIAFTKILNGGADEEVTNLESLVEEITQRRWPILQIEANAKLGLVKFLRGDIDQSIAILEANATLAQQIQYSRAGTALAYVRGREAIRKGNFEDAQKFAKKIMKKAKSEEDLWLEWVALDLLIAYEKSTGGTTDHFMESKQRLVRNLNQTKPHELVTNLNPDNLPLFELV